MTTNFVSRDSQNSIDKLNAFVKKYESMGAFGLREQLFHDDAWKTNNLSSKGKSGYIYFSKINYNPVNHRNKKGKPSSIPIDMAMPAQYSRFSKAIISHLHITNKSTAIPNRCIALKWLLAALEEQGEPVDPTEICVATLDHACELLRQSDLNITTQALIASAISIIWETMVEQELVQLPADWEVPIRLGETNSNVKLGEEFDALRMKKLPNPRAIEALGILFQSDGHDLRTIFVSSYAAIALCAPERSVEFLFAPASLLTTWTDPDTLDEGVSLRWFPAKGAEPQCKNVSLNMSEIARRAYKRLYSISQPARDLALWYETNPTKIYLPSDLEYLRTKSTIDINEAHAILYGGPVRKLDTLTNEHRLAKDFLKQNNVPFNRTSTGRGGRPGTLLFHDLEKAVLRNLPHGFPIMDPSTGMKYSEALCVLRRHEFSGFKVGCMPAVLQLVSYSMLMTQLVGSASSKSIFTQHGFVGDQGELLRITTHQFRHYLNTIVRNSGNLNEEEIAVWSGRKNINQNFVYDHRSADDKLHQLEVQLGFHSDTKPFGDISKRIFIKKSQFGDIEKITAHLTDIGYCLHNYMQSPCPIMENCVQCQESVCIMGELRSREAVERLLTESTRLTNAAQMDMDQGMDGAADWVKVHLEREAVLRNLLAILNNPNIPDGTPITLNVKTPNRLKEIISRRTIPIQSVAASIQSLDDVAHLLAAPPMNAMDMTDET